MKLFSVLSATLLSGALAMNDGLGDLDMSNNDDLEDMPAPDGNPAPSMDNPVFVEGENPSPGPESPSPDPELQTEAPVVVTYATLYDNSKSGCNSAGRIEQPCRGNDADLACTPQACQQYCTDNSQCEFARFVPGTFQSSIVAGGCLLFSQCEEMTAVSVGTTYMQAGATAPVEQATKPAPSTDTGSASGDGSIDGFTVFLPHSTTTCRISPMDMPCNSAKPCAAPKCQQYCAAEKKCQFAASNDADGCLLFPSCDGTKTAKQAVVVFKKSA